MSDKYQVLARKYRPDNFGDLKGQEVLVKIISNAIKMGRIAHAFLLSGIRGIGKTTSARIIAKTINCTDIQSQDDCVKPCMKCPNCIAYQDDKHPDLIEIDAASKTGVNDIRELIDNSRYRPILGKYKIYIIDEVHMLSTSAFNALLKTLEEPPAHVKFIFATTELRKIPLTILSRCQRFDLRRLSKQEMVAHLKEICVKENTAVTDEGLAKIAEISEGSVRDALSLMDQVYNSNTNAEEIDFAKVCNSLGVASKDEILEISKHLLLANIPMMLKKFGEVYFAGMSPVLVIEEILNLINDITKYKTTGDRLLLSNQDETYVTMIGEYVNHLNHAKLLYLWQVLFKGIREIQNASNQYSCAEMVLMKSCFITKTSDNIVISPGTTKEVSHSIVDELKASQPIVEQKVELVKVVTAEVAMDCNDDQLMAFRKFVGLFRDNHELIIHHSLSHDIHLVSFREGELVFRQKAGVPHNLANQVAKLAKEITGNEWKVRIVAIGGHPTLIEMDQTSNISVEQGIVQDELVQNILNNFEGSKITKIIDIEETTS